MNDVITSEGGITASPLYKQGCRAEFWFVAEAVGATPTHEDVRDFDLFEPGLTLEQNVEAIVHAGRLQLSGGRVEAQHVWEGPWTSDPDWLDF